MAEFNPHYAAQLREQYPGTIVDQITARPDAVNLNEDGSSKLQYIKVKADGEDSIDQAIVFIPGFCAGIVNKASFAAELATKGCDVVLPDQNRKGFAKDDRGNNDATLSQAQNYISLFESVASGGEKKPALVSHSYGSLVVARMVEEKPELFSDVDFVLLAPSGLTGEKSYFSLLKRYIDFVKSETSTRRPMTFPDVKGVSFRAAAATLLKNPRRSIAEVKDLKRLSIDLEALISNVGSVSVISYAEDKLYPRDIHARGVEPHIVGGADIVWVSPVIFDGSLSRPGLYRYGGDGAVHNDDQFNPARAVGAVLSVLKQAQDKRS